MALSVPLISAAVSFCILYFCFRIHPLLYFAVCALMCWQIFAARCLHDRFSAMKAGLHLRRVRDDDIRHLIGWPGQIVSAAETLYRVLRQFQLVGNIIHALSGFPQASDLIFLIDRHRVNSFPSFVCSPSYAQKSGRFTVPPDTF